MSISGQPHAFPNGYELVNGVECHALYGDRFEISSPWLRNSVGPAHFVELRLDSSRVSVHPDAEIDCRCDACDATTDKPILCHEQPHSLMPIGRHAIPSRGWGEQFWVRIQERAGCGLLGVVDNDLYETHLHGLSLGDAVGFTEDHILTVHPSHHRVLIENMSDVDMRDHLEWIRKRQH